MQDETVNCLTYSYKIAMQFIHQRKFRDEILEELVRLYQALDIPDYVNMCQCLIHLDKPHELASILDKLVKDDTLKSDSLDNQLMAYQIAFDLYESATQDLLSHVRQGLRMTAPVPSLLTDPTAPKAKSTEEASKDGKSSETEKMEEDQPSTETDQVKEPTKTIDDLVSNIFISVWFIVLINLLMYSE